MHSPLVTCLCLTRNRREWLPKALECFARQTYHNCELLVIADSESDVEGIVPRALICPGVVGKKRNFGCTYAAGELIAIWDDDDYSAPGRIEAQVRRLELSQKQVTAYHSMKFTDSEKWWQYIGGPNSGLATSLMFTREHWKGNLFQEINCGQDEHFIATAASRRQFVAEPDLNLMYATNHPKNTSPRTNLRGQCWKPLPGFRWPEEAVCAT